MKNTILLLLIFGLINTLFAETRDAKKELYKLLTTEIPTKLCQPNMIYRECYLVSADECHDIMYMSIKGCFKTFENNISNDSTLNQLSKTGGKIGECSGMIYDIILTKASKRDTECLKNPKWEKILE
jgi:hypothetical protein